MNVHSYISILDQMTIQVLETRSQMPRTAAGSSDQHLFEVAFGVTHMKEHFNRTAAVYIRDHVLPAEEQTASLCSGREALNSLIDDAKGSNVVHVTYRKGMQSKGKGRWFASSLSSMQRMPKRIRHSICNGLWIDLDFANVQPSILASLCKKWDFKHSFLANYVTNREDILAELVGAGVECREKAKEIILVVMFGGSPEKVAVEWWDEMCCEFREIAKLVAMHVDNREFRDTCILADKTTNFNAKVMNTVLCYYENSCLEQLYHYLVNKKCIEDGYCCLVFDGIMIKDTAHNQACLSDANFLKEATVCIEKALGFTLEIKMKALDSGYDLPAGYADAVDDIALIEKGDDMQAARLFLQKYGHRLVKSEGRVFWYEQGVYTDDKEAVQKGITRCVANMKIYSRCGKNLLVPYSGSYRHVHDCLKFVLADNSMERSNFLRELWNSNLKHIAFENGVFSFEGQCFTPYPVEGVFFTHKIRREFPRTVDDATKQQLMDRIIIPIMPDEQQRGYLLHCLARALAGEIYDKRWYICVGERNSGKGVLCELMSAAFQDFVQTIMSENLIYSR